MTRLVEASDAAIAEAASLLRAGGLVAFPTETVYGLGARADRDAAVAGIYRAKQRPAHNPLIVHVPDLAGVRALAHLDARAEALADAFWPGPLTLVLRRREGSGISSLATAGLPTIAVRVPSHPVARALLEAAGCPVAAPSANPSGRLSPTAGADVAADLGDALDMVLDGGVCAVGLESTVVDASAPDGLRLLRPGGLGRERIEAVAGPMLATGEDEPVRSPGQLLRHYAPGRPVRLDCREVAADEALLAFGDAVPTGAAMTLNLSPTGDLGEAASNLFSMLRRLDRPQVRRIAVMPVPDHGLGEAINDRLRRAAAATSGDEG